MGVQPWQAKSPQDVKPCCSCCCCKLLLLSGFDSINTPLKVSVCYIMLPIKCLLGSEAGYRLCPDSVGCLPMIREYYSYQNPNSRGVGRRKETGSSAICMTSHRHVKKGAKPYQSCAFGGAITSSQTAHWQVTWVLLVQHGLSTSLLLLPPCAWRFTSACHLSYSAWARTPCGDDSVPNSFLLPAGDATHVGSQLCMHTDNVASGHKWGH